MPSDISGRLGWLFFTLIVVVTLSSCGHSPYTFSPPQGQTVINTSTQKAWRDSNGIVWAVVKPGASEDSAAAKEAVEAQTALAKGSRVPVLYNMAELATISEAARDYYYNSDASVAESAAFAVVQPSPFVVFMCNHFGLPLLHPRVPSRCFVDESKAYAWLQTFIVDDP